MRPADHADGSLPRAWVVCPRFGETSETWLARQVGGMTRFRVKVVCWGTGENVPDGAAAETAVLPFPFRADAGLRRWALRFKNLRGGNYFGTSGAERRRIRSLLSEDRPRVVLCHFGFAALRVLPATLESRIPLVAHFHGVDASAGLGNRWYRRSLERWAKRFAAVVVVAGYQGDLLRRMGVPDDRIHVIPCGVPVEAATVATDVSRQPCRFVAVGRFVPKKSPLSTLRAFARCSRRVAGISLTMIGDGPLLPPARDLARDLGIGDRVAFRGALPQHQVAEEVASAGAFVQHSVTGANGDKEGWPVSIAEASAAGLPVVATRHAEIPNQIPHGEAGYLVDEHDVDAMGDAMERLALDPVLRSRFGDAGRRRMAERFDARGQIRRLEEVMRHVCGPVESRSSR